MAGVSMALRDLPELGPYLGRLADATRRFDPDPGLDAIRLELVSELFERAAAARGFLMTGDESGARSSLDRGAWLGLWRTAAGAAADGTIATATATLQRAAARVRYPDRRLASLLPGAEARTILLARLEAAGIPLEERLQRGFASGEGWWDDVRQAAVALEDSWEALEEVVRRELVAATGEAARIERWRPSLAGWYLALGAAIAVSGWLGLVLGGWIQGPGWLQPFADWFWSLPWP